ncbi:TPA: peroxiredoxin [Candidatus Woesearchaeota archaeon]|nr:peroxiredoxin [Candidatus Woesearchaeota archaeon]
MIKVGEKAPTFDAECYHNGQITRISSNDYKKNWIVLFFYPRDFTFVCPTELKAFARKEPEFKKLNAVVISASTDSAFSHKAWMEQDLPDVKYPIIADTNHSISRAYDVLIEETGAALRGTFIIDPDGILQYAVVSNLNVGRSTDETLRVLEALQTGGLCPMDWHAGEETLDKKKK